MLVLARNLTPYEVRTCKLSGEKIIYGDYYYQDTEDPNLYIKKSAYDRFDREQKENKFDYSKLEQLESQAEYEQYLKQAEQEYLANNILKHKIIKNGTIVNAEL